MKYSASSIHPFFFANYFIFILFFILSSSPALSQKTNRFSYKEPHMGTSFKIILYADNKEIADLAARKAYQKIEALNQLMSDYIPESEVSNLSKYSGTKKKIKVSKDLFRVLKQSKKWSKRTKGNFDNTIGPLSKLWRKAFRQKVFPDSLEILEAKSCVNYRWVKLYFFTKKVRLLKKNMRLDLGGIAKGYAVDEAMKVLKKQGIKSALIDGGGDILVSEAPPDGSGWLIITPNFKTQISLENEAIATSGGTYQYLEWNNKKYSHIINPITGYGTEDERIVTVTAKNCINADALASACSILSAAEIKNLKKSKKWKVTFYKD